MTHPGLAQRIVRWQRTHGRHDLPWQGTRDAYRVWLSEVMLQQTQVATVRGYYARFLQRFPDVAALAAASLDDVLACWSGLGYYGRARNLHRCAQVVVAEHGGMFPCTSTALEALPGIGRSTAAAIAALCFGQRCAILDGNAKRVLARALGFEGDLSLAAQERALWELALALLPHAHVDVYTQGLMDLGATVCLRRAPACARCPLLGTCVASQQGDAQRLPLKSRRAARSRRENALLLLSHRKRWWLVQRPAQGVWAGLWSLPEYASVPALTSACEAWPGRGRWLSPSTHALTHFDWSLHWLAWRWPAQHPLPSDLPGCAQGRWFSLQQALALGLPAPVRAVLARQC